MIGPDGTIRPISFQEYSRFDKRQWVQFCKTYGIYQIVTEELLHFLSPFLTDRTIEICAGLGTLGRSLGIPLTDRRLQEDHKVQVYYQTIDQPTIKYPPDVEKLTAHQALVKYQPDTVIAAWASHKDKKTDPKMGSATRGNPYGVEFEKIIDSVETFIHIGNYAHHGKNPALKRRHVTFRAEWLVSRASLDEDNTIYIWSKKKSLPLPPGSSLAGLK
jgi:hypothetical protein